ncbi:outer membrane protein assembly factor BamB family protein [Streptomyces sp. DW26H14]|uniref:outer membrane protein assembly factor BamB family protein n=1 Tax=Streptomyces sp. DW26H14 TaxID=3435395 RepID=UPI00403D871D
MCGVGADGLTGRSRATGAVTWQIPSLATGRNVGLVLAVPDGRAVAAGADTLHAADLRTGSSAWSHRLTPGRAYAALAEGGGAVYALDTTTGPPGDTRTVTLDAYRTTDGTALWHRSVHADATAPPRVIGGRVYTTDGSTVTARGARTGRVVATGPAGTDCPQLLSGAGYLVCTGSRFSASDTFPPVVRLDPATLRPVRTLRDSGMKPVAGVFSDGVLVLYEEGAEDSSAGDWSAFDLGSGAELWSYHTTTGQGALDGGSFTTFTPSYDTAGGRLISIDLRAGPEGTGAAAPRFSPAYPDTDFSRYPSVVVPGGGAGHLLVQSTRVGTLRSVPSP